MSIKKRRRQLFFGLALAILLSLLTSAWPLSLNGAEFQRTTG